MLSFHNGRGVPPRILSLLFRPRLRPSASSPGVRPCGPPTTSPTWATPPATRGQFNSLVTSGGSYDPLTANATRTVTDLTVPGSVGAYPLTFSRTANSRYVGGLASLFGDGGNWRHNFQYELRYQNGGTSGAMVLTYPDGRNVVFNALAASDPRYVDAAVKPPSSLLYGTAGIPDRLDDADINHPVLRMADGGRVQFEYYMPAGSSTPAYRPILIIDPFGQGTSIQYWAADTQNIHYVTEPGGRWLQVDWLPPYNGAPRVTIAGVTAWNGQNVTYTYGQWQNSPQGSPYVVLTGAQYSAEPTAANSGVPVAASYDYYGDVSGGAPLLGHCYDPHFPGAMWGILYAYDNSRASTGGWGRVAQGAKPLERGGVDQPRHPAELRRQPRPRRVRWQGAPRDPRRPGRGRQRQSPGALLRLLAQL